MQAEQAKTWLLRWLGRAGSDLLRR